PSRGDPGAGVPPLAAVHPAPRREALLGAELDQVAAEDLRMAGDVVDVLLLIDRCDLAAGLLDRVDDPAGGVAMAGVVRGGEPRRARPEDRDVDDAVRAHLGRNGSRPSVYACDATTWGGAES